MLRLHPRVGPSEAVVPFCGVIPILHGKPQPPPVGMAIRGIVLSTLRSTRQCRTETEPRAQIRLPVFALRKSCPEYGECCERREASLPDFDILPVSKPTLVYDFIGFAN
jgi:hypothetical protein